MYSVCKMTGVGCPHYTHAVGTQSLILKCIKLCTYVCTCAFHFYSHACIACLHLICAHVTRCTLPSDGLQVVCGQYTYMLHWDTVHLLALQMIAHWLPVSTGLHHRVHTLHVHATAVVVAMCVLYA